MKCKVTQHTAMHYTLLHQTGQYWCSLAVAAMFRLIKRHRDRGAVMTRWSYRGGAPIVQGWCSDCTEVVLRLYRVGAPIVQGWCSDCTEVVLRLYRGGAPVVQGWCSDCTEVVV